MWSAISLPVFGKILSYIPGTPVFRTRLVEKTGNLIPYELGKDLFEHLQHLRAEQFELDRQLGLCENAEDVRFLLKLGARPNQSRALIPYACLSDPGCVRELLQHPSTDPNITTHDGYTALVIAVSGSIGNEERAVLFQAPKIQMISELLRHPRTDPNCFIGRSTIQSRSDYRRTVLQACIRERDYVLCSILLKHARTDPDVQDHHGNTALHYAVEFFPEFVEKLVQDGRASPYISNSEGKIPLQQAIEDRADSWMIEILSDYMIQ
jgi:ankyrin repeat protein